MFPAEGDKGGVTLVTKKTKHAQRPGSHSHSTTFGANKSTRKCVSQSPFSLLFSSPSYLTPLVSIPLPTNKLQKDLQSHRKQHRQIRLPRRSSTRSRLPRIRHPSLAKTRQGRAQGEIERRKGEEGCGGGKEGGVSGGVPRMIGVKAVYCQWRESICMAWYSYQELQ